MKRLLPVLMGFALLLLSSTTKAQPEKILKTSVTLCDELAAHPADPFRVSNGFLKWDMDFDRALMACEDANKVFPEQPRLWTQWARVLFYQSKFPRALTLIKKASENGYAHAQSMLGSILNPHGKLKDKFDVNPDMEKAISLWRLSAKQGHPMSNYFLGLVYRKGDGVDADITKSVAYAKRSADLGWPQALNSVGVAYKNGVGGLKEDKKEGYRFFTAAASFGLRIAMKNLGRMYQLGDGVNADYSKAYYWYKLALSSNLRTPKLNIKRRSEINSLLDMLEITEGRKREIDHGVSNFKPKIPYTSSIYLASAGKTLSRVIAMKTCPGSPLTGSYSDVKTWNNCEGTHIFDSPPRRIGDKYVGEWKDGKPNGQGSFYILAEDNKFKGNKYVGEWKNGIRHGHFTVTYPNGNKYVGGFKNQQKNGQGTFTFASGNKYVGEWKNGKNHGQGTFTFANGDEYVGEWKNGKNHGQGTFTFANGDEYVGEYRENKYHGQGTFTFTDGGKYVGEFDDGKYNGQGTFTFADGRVEEGIWENNKFLYAKKLSSTMTAKNSSSEGLKSRLLLIKRLESNGLITKEEAASKRQKILGSSSTDEQDAKPTVTAKKTTSYNPKHLARLKGGHSCSYCNLAGADLQGADLTAAILVGANLKGANLTDANLEGADLTDAYLWTANLQGAKLDSEGVKIAKATGAINVPETVVVVKKPSSTVTAENKTTFNPEHLKKFRFSNKCPKCNLQFVNFQGADLKGADLAGANLDKTSFFGADLRSANLSEANLRGADLNAANLQGANLQGANFKGANLAGAYLDAEGIKIAKASGALNVSEAWENDDMIWRVLHDKAREGVKGYNTGIQKALRTLGLYSGKIDGVIGARTRSAIERWQKRNSLRSTGEVTEIQFAKLEQEAATTAKKTPKVNPAPAKPDITPAQGRDTTPPTIQIASSIAVKEDSPTIRGRVSDNEKVVQVTVEGRAANLRSNGRFNFKRYVPPSGTKVTIEAVDEWGNRSTKIVRLIRKKSETATRRFNPLDPTKFSARRNPNAVALIIGITKYKRTVDAKYADKDAQFFSDYARRKLGVPQSNIKVLTNEKAGSTDIFEAAANWLPSATQAGKSDVYIFYAGHGLSSADGKEVYLIPYNGSPTLLEQTALHRTKLFRSIADARPRSVTVFLDTCYSGTARTNEILVASRGIRVVPRELEIPTRFTVFSAASTTQTAQIFDETGHGLFSYWLMKGMEGGADKNKDRKITTGELHDYVRNNVTRLRRDQTPQLKGNKETVLMRW